MKNIMILVVTNDCDIYRARYIVLNRSIEIVWFEFQHRNNLKALSV